MTFRVPDFRKSKSDFPEKRKWCRLSGHIFCKTFLVLTYCQKLINLREMKFPKLSDNFIDLSFPPQNSFSTSISKIVGK